jgi:hypothetical protein
MARNREKVEILWKRLEDAKLQLDFSHNYTREVVDDLRSEQVRSSEEESACGRAVRVEELAIQNYGRHLDELHRAIVCSGGVSDERRDQPSVSEPAFPLRSWVRWVWLSRFD